MLTQTYSDIQPMKCDVCNSIIQPLDNLSVGYAIDGNNQDIVCYECCGKRDTEYMKQHNRNTLYLTMPKTVKPYWHRYGNTGECELSNWSGTLKIKASFSTGRHNLAGVRYDVWFRFDNSNWHGVTCGDDTQLCHVKRLKH